MARSIAMRSPVSSSLETIGQINTAAPSQKSPTSRVRRYWRTRIAAMAACKTTAEARRIFSVTWAGMGKSYHAQPFAYTLELLIKLAEGGDEVVRSVAFELL